MPPAKKTAPKKAAAKRPTAKKAAAKRPTAIKRPAAKKATARKPTLKFGRAGTAGKAEGDAPVQAYIAQLPTDHRAIAERVDAIVSKTVPNVRRAIKWSMPMYGLEGQGWFLAFASFKKYCAVRFFEGAKMTPLPPEGEGKNGRSVNYASVGDIDEAQLAAWVKQAAAMPGWGS